MNSIEGGRMATEGRVARALSGGRALIPFVTAGDPDLGTTERLAVALAEAGADLLLLGIPFSDPTMESPIVQAANLRGRDAGVTTDAVFDAAARIRSAADVPLGFLTYANVVFSYGAQRFARRMAEAGMDVLVLHDVPVEERAEFAESCRAAGIALASTIAPTSLDRVRAAADAAEGFVRCAAAPAAADAVGEVASMAGQVRAARPGMPCVADCGATSPEQVAALAHAADGVIVDDAVVSLVAEKGSACIEPAAAFVRACKDALAKA